MQRRSAGPLSAMTVVAVLVGCTTDPTVADAPTSAGPVTAPDDASTPPAAGPVEPTEAPTADEPVQVALEDVVDGLDAPVHAFGWAGRTYVVEQVGRVTDLEDGSSWLDLTDRVRSGGEQGLLGVTVHPSGSHVVAHWSGSDGATTLATYGLEDGVPDVGTERVVLRVPQPASNHNGGSVVFAPDGMLLLALGDGGGAGDRYGNGQDPDTLLGALLRLDLDDPAVARVPADNPFVDGGGAPEVWVYGLRNPYRIAVDATQVYIADVGQDAVEEVTALRFDQTGANLGWPQVEGDRCFTDGCDLSAFEPADVTYTHADTDGCSVIGGHVYGGDAIPGLRGHFVYGDLCGGILRTVRAVDGDVVAELDLTAQVGSVAGVTGIGADADGELLLTFGDGRVRRLVSAR